MFDPDRMPARVDGWAVHPDVYLPQWYPEGTRPEQDSVAIDRDKLLAAGWEVMYVTRHVDEPDRAQLYDVQDELWCSTWNPTRPSWTLVSIYNSNEGPASMFVRRLSPAVVIRASLQAVIDATCAYLPPDGISKDEFINRVLGATDNPAINAAMAER